MKKRQSEFEEEQVKKRMKVEIEGADMDLEGNLIHQWKFQLETERNPRLPDRGCLCVLMTFVDFLWVLLISSYKYEDFDH